MNCPHCKSETKFKSGIKNGKKWSGDFCQNPDCGYVNWHREGSTQFVKQGQELKVRTEPDWEAIRKERDTAIKQNMELKSQGMAKGAAFNKACDIAIALYQKGDITSDFILSKITELFTELKEINSDE